MGRFANERISKVTGKKLKTLIIPGKHAMVAPLTYVPLYLQLLAMTKKNCVSVPSSETALTAVCTDLLSGVTKLKTELDAVKEILPSTAQMSELKNIAWTFPSTNDTTQASKKVLRMVLDVAAMSKKPLYSDEEAGNLFSESRLSSMKEDIQKGELPELTDFDRAELIVQNLVQTRMIRVENANFYHWSQIMLIIIMCPQLLILVFIMIQFALLKRREHRMRKNTLKMSRERSLMQSLLTEMRGQQNLEERPAAVVAHL